MASPRRRTSYSSSTPSDEVIDELSNISEKEVEVVEEETPDPEPLVEVLLPEITPTEAPPPYEEKVIIEPIVEHHVPAQNNPQELKAPKRHPRNIPKFSPKRG